MSEPVFDHSQPAMEVQGQGYKLLKQGENYFSYAEWNKFTGRFEHPPRPCPGPGEDYRELSDLYRCVLTELKALADKLAQIENSIRSVCEESEREQMQESEAAIGDAQKTLDETTARLEGIREQNRNLFIENIQLRRRHEELSAELAD